VKQKTTTHKGRISLLIIAGMLLLTACAGLPPITAVQTAAVSKTLLTCEKAFPKGRWLFAHVIEAALPGGREAQLIGVTEISSGTERIHAIMMTIENLVLFDGIMEGGKLTINRGVSPFDADAFAKGLMEDIRLMFIEPDGDPIVAGLTEDGCRVCRYRVSKDVMVDVLVGPDKMLEIRKYHHERLIRKVVGKPTPIPEKIIFTAYEPAGYRLNLRLISAEQINN